MRAAVVITASALVAVNPALLAASGAIQNDAPSILLAALVMLLLARATRRASTPEPSPFWPCPWRTSAC